MEAAYNVGMEMVPSDYAELYEGDLSGHSLSSGIYKWSNNVVISSDVTLSGSASDIWIFQISGMLTQAVGADILLADGAKADNVFWLVAQAVTIGAGAHFEGVILAQTAISMGSGSSINGRLLAQTAITLADATVNSSVVAPTEINVRAEGQVSVITVNGGTLQMSVEILPSNASNKSVIWSVENVTGEALISPLGLLSALADGVVNVKATSANYPDIFGVKAITISNQAAESKAALVDAVEAAIFNKNSVEISVDGSDILPEDQWVSASVLADYNDAIVAAQAVIDNVDATQAQVDDAVLALADASDVFNAAKAFGTYVEEVGESIDLGVAGDFAVLAKTGISTTGTTYVTGNLGASPVAASGITGFELVADASNEFSKSIYASGNIYASDYAEPTPTYLTTAVLDMEGAYTYGMGLAADETELFAGDLSGQTLVGGVYKWGNDVHIDTELTLSGSATDTWIFQISGKLTQAEGISVELTGGALAKNIYWVVADTVAVGTDAHLEGNVIGMVNISMGTNSSLNGRLLAQTAVTLNSAIVVEPN
ncbi:MAG: ice-binding family protein, partial [Bacilli bacterium]